MRDRFGIFCGRRARRFVQGAGLLLAISGAPGCSESVISVLPARSLAQHAETPVTVAVDATSVRLPMRVSGTSVTYGDVDRALSRSIETAIARALPKLRLGSGQRLSLFVEILEARAEYGDGRLVITLDTRATLRRVSGNTYVAQTHAHARHSGHVKVAHGSPVIIACIDSIATQLSGWLLGLDLR